MVSNSLPLGGSKGNTAQILVMAYLNGSDGSKKPETPHVGSAPDWCSVSVSKVDTLENHYMLSLTALSDNNTGANRSGHIFLTCGNANLSIPVTQEPTLEYWEIRFNPPITINGVDTSAFFDIATNIRGESGSMADGTRYKNWIVNQNRHMINVYIAPIYPGTFGNFEMLSWSCLDKDGNAFSPNYNIPDNQYFTIKTTGFGSYTLKKVSTPSVGSGTLILSSRFNPTKKYPLDLNFYWGAPT